MREALHDEIDTIEELSQQSRELTEQIARQAILDHLQASADSDDILTVLQEALLLAAAAVAEEHDAITTRAVRIGADAALKRVERSV